MPNEEEGFGYVLTSLNTTFRVMRFPLRNIKQGLIANILAEYHFIFDKKIEDGKEIYSPILRLEDSRNLKDFGVDLK